MRIINCWWCRNIINFDDKDPEGYRCRCGALIQVCPKCNGSGADTGEMIGDCDQCDGKGLVTS
jgi:hypothetical protein